jgi:hypothetical protein
MGPAAILLPAGEGAEAVAGAGVALTGLKT